MPAMSVVSEMIAVGLAFHHSVVTEWPLSWTMGLVLGD